MEHYTVPKLVMFIDCILMHIGAAILQYAEQPLAG
jgi:hypothetical protein